MDGLFEPDATLLADPPTAAPPQARPLPLPQANHRRNFDATIAAQQQPKQPRDDDDVDDGEDDFDDDEFGEYLDDIDFLQIIGSDTAQHVQGTLAVGNVFIELIDSFKNESTQTIVVDVGRASTVVGHHLTANFTSIAPAATSLEPPSLKAVGESGGLRVTVFPNLLHFATAAALTTSTPTRPTPASPATSSMHSRPPPRSPAGRTGGGGGGGGMDASTTSSGGGNVNSAKAAQHSSPVASISFVLKNNVFTAAHTATNFVELRARAISGQMSRLSDTAATPPHQHAASKASNGDAAPPPLARAASASAAGLKAARAAAAAATATSGAQRGNRSARDRMAESTTEIPRTPRDSGLSASFATAEELLVAASAVAASAAATSTGAHHLPHGGSSPVASSRKTRLTSSGGGGARPSDRHSDNIATSLKQRLVQKAQLAKERLAAGSFARAPTFYPQRAMADSVCAVADDVIVRYVADITLFRDVDADRLPADMLASFANRSKPNQPASSSSNQQQVEDANSTATVLSFSVTQIAASSQTGLLAAVSSAEPPSSSLNRSSSLDSPGLKRATAFGGSAALPAVPVRPSHQRTVQLHLTRPLVDIPYRPNAAEIIQPQYAELVDAWNGAVSNWRLVTASASAATAAAAGTNATPSGSPSTSRNVSVSPRLPKTSDVGGVAAGASRSASPPSSSTTPTMPPSSSRDNASFGTAPAGATGTDGASSTSNGARGPAVQQPSTVTTILSFSAKAAGVRVGLPRNVASTLEANTVTVWATHAPLEERASLRLHVKQPTLRSSNGHGSGGGAKSALPPAPDRILPLPPMFLFVYKDGPRTQVSLMIDYIEALLSTELLSHALLMHEKIVNEIVAMLMNSGATATSRSGGAAATPEHAHGSDDDDDSATDTSSNATGSDRQQQQQQQQTRVNVTFAGCRLVFVSSLCELRMTMKGLTANAVSTSRGETLQWAAALHGLQVAVLDRDDFDAVAANSKSRTWDGSIDASGGGGAARPARGERRATPTPPPQLPSQLPPSPTTAHLQQQGPQPHVSAAVSKKGRRVDCGYVWGLLDVEVTVSNVGDSRATVAESQQQPNATSAQRHQLPDAASRPAHSPAGAGARRVGHARTTSWGAEGSNAASAPGVRSATPVNDATPVICVATKVSNPTVILRPGLVPHAQMIIDEIAAGLAAAQLEVSSDAMRIREQLHDSRQYQRLLRRSNKFAASMATNAMDFTSRRRPSVDRGLGGGGGVDAGMTSTIAIVDIRSFLLVMPLGDRVYSGLLRGDPALHAVGGAERGTQLSSARNVSTLDRRAMIAPFAVKLAVDGISCRARIEPRLDVFARGGHLLYVSPDEAVATQPSSGDPQESSRRVHFDAPLDSPPPSFGASSFYADSFSAGQSPMRRISSAGLLHQAQHHHRHTSSGSTIGDSLRHPSLLSSTDTATTASPSTAAATRIVVRCTASRTHLFITEGTRIDARGTQPMRLLPRDVVIGGIGVLTERNAAEIVRSKNAIELPVVHIDLVSDTLAVDGTSVVKLEVGCDRPQVQISSLGPHLLTEAAADVADLAALPLQYRTQQLQRQPSAAQPQTPAGVSPECASFAEPPATALQLQQPASPSLESSAAAKMKSGTAPRSSLDITVSVVGGGGIKLYSERPQPLHSGEHRRARFPQVHRRGAATASTTAAAATSGVGLRSAVTARTAGTSSDVSASGAAAAEGRDGRHRDDAFSAFEHATTLVAQLPFPSVQVATASQSGGLVADPDLTTTYASIGLDQIIVTPAIAALAPEWAMWTRRSKEERRERAAAILAAIKAIEDSAAAAVGAASPQTPGESGSSRSGGAASAVGIATAAASAVMSPLTPGSSFAVPSISTTFLNAVVPIPRGFAVQATLFVLEQTSAAKRRQRGAGGNASDDAVAEAAKVGMMRAAPKQSAVDLLAAKLEAATERAAVANTKASATMTFVRIEGLSVGLSTTPVTPTTAATVSVEDKDGRIDIVTYSGSVPSSQIASLITAAATAGAAVSPSFTTNATTATSATAASAARVTSLLQRVDRGDFNVQSFHFVAATKLAAEVATRMEAKCLDLRIPELQVLVASHGVKSKLIINIPSDVARAAHPSGAAGGTPLSSLPAGGAAATEMIVRLQHSSQLQQLLLLWESRAREAASALPQLRAMMSDAVESRIDRVVESAVRVPADGTFHELLLHADRVGVAVDIGRGGKFDATVLGLALSSSSQAKSPMHGSPGASAPATLHCASVALRSVDVRCDGALTGHIELPNGAAMKHMWIAQPRRHTIAAASAFAPVVTSIDHRTQQLVVDIPRVAARLREHHVRDVALVDIANLSLAIRDRVPPDATDGALKPPEAWLELKVGRYTVGVTAETVASFAGVANTARETVAEQKAAAEAKLAAANIGFVANAGSAPSAGTAATPPSLGGSSSANACAAAAPDSTSSTAPASPATAPAFPTEPPPLEAVGGAAFFPSPIAPQHLVPFAAVPMFRVPVGEVIVALKDGTLMVGAIVPVSTTAPSQASFDIAAGGSAGSGGGSGVVLFVPELSVMFAQCIGAAEAEAEAEHHRDAQRLSVAETLDALAHKAPNYAVIGGGLVTKRALVLSIPGGWELQRAAGGAVVTPHLLAPTGSAATSASSSSLGSGVLRYFQGGTAAGSGRGAMSASTPLAGSTSGLSSSMPGVILGCRGSNRFDIVSVQPIGGNRVGYVFDFRHTAPWGGSPRISDFEALNAVLATFAGGSSSSGNTSGGAAAPGGQSDARVFDALRPIRFDPELRVVGDISVSIDMVLQWVGVSEGLVPLLLMKNVCDPLEACLVAVDESFVYHVDDDTNRE